MVTQRQLHFACFQYRLTDDLSAVGLAGTKFVVAYQDVGNSGYGTAVVGDVSGSVITFGSECVFNNASTGSVSAATLSDTKLVVVYRDSGNSGYGTAALGDVAVSGITFGSEYVFYSESTLTLSAAALSDTKFAVAYRDENNSFYGTAVVGDVAGKAITLGSEYVFNSGNTSELSTAALSRTKFVAAYKDGGNSGYGTAVVGEIGIPLGIADAGASSGESVPVILHGISDHHAGLIPPTFYYAESDGGLTATETSTRVGIAISSTELLLDIER